MRAMKKINVNTYNCHVIYIITDAMRETEKYLTKKYGGEYDQPVDYDDSEGVTITITGKLYVVMIDYKYLTHNTIAHELYHTTRRITEDRAITDEESSAWLAGFLSEEFYKFLTTTRVTKAFDKLVKDKDGKTTESTGTK